MRRRYLPGAALGAATLGAVLLALAGRTTTFGLILVAVGAPLTALLLAAGACGGEVPLRRLVLSLVLGATAVPAAVLALHTAFAAAAYGLVAPLAAAGRSLLDELRADPTLVGVFSSPWAFFLLIDLAVVAPLAEEMLKPLGSLFRRLRSPADAFLCGAAAGAGFAAVENLLYASGGWYSNESWVAVSLVRSSGAAVHLVGAGLVTLAVYRVRREARPFASLLGWYAAAAGLHAAWNGTIGVTLILFNEREIVAGGLGGTAYSWGMTLYVALAVLGTVALGVLIGFARRTGAKEAVTGSWLDLGKPEGVAAWAALGAAMLVPAIILLLALPGFLAL